MKMKTRCDDALVNRRSKQEEGSGEIFTYVLSEEAEESRAERSEAGVPEEKGKGKQAACLAWLKGGPSGRKGVKIIACLAPNYLFIRLLHTLPPLLPEDDYP